MAGFLKREDQPVFAYCEAYGFGGRAAEELHVAVIATTSADGVLRAETRRGDLKRGARVIVEPADEAPVLLILDAAQIELAFEGGVVRLAFIAEVFGDARKFLDVRLLGFELGVEDAQRVGVDAALRVGAELVFDLGEFGAEPFDI